MKKVSHAYVFIFTLCSIIFIPHAGHNACSRLGNTPNKKAPSHSPCPSAKMMLSIESILISPAIRNRSPLLNGKQTLTQRPSTMPSAKKTRKHTPLTSLSKYTLHLQQPVDEANLRFTYYKRIKAHSKQNICIYTLEQNTGNYIRSRCLQPPPMCMMLQLNILQHLRKLPRRCKRVYRSPAEFPT